jgi:hypothetical protein
MAEKRTETMFVERGDRWVEIYHDKGKTRQPWRYRLVYANGEKGARGEGHPDPHKALLAASRDLGPGIPVRIIEKSPEEVTE